MPMSPGERNRGVSSKSAPSVGSTVFADAANPAAREWRQVLHRFSTVGLRNPAGQASCLPSAGVVAGVLASALVSMTMAVVVVPAVFGAMRAVGAVLLDAPVLLLSVLRNRCRG